MLQILTFVLTGILAASCGTVYDALTDGPGDWQLVETSGLGIKLSLQPPLLKFHPDFFNNVDSYYLELHKRLNAAGLINTSASQAISDASLIHVGITPSQTLGSAGLFNGPREILIDQADDITMLRVFGHELVRFFFLYDGNAEAAYQSSGNWSGPMGRAWNIAENLANQMELK